MPYRVTATQAQLFYDTAKKTLAIDGRVEMSFRANPGRDIHTLRCSPRGNVTVAVLIDGAVDMRCEQYRDLRDFAVVYGLQQG